MDEPTVDLKERAQKLVHTLVQRGMTPRQIEEKLEGRVSWRTLYRWLQGESGPQQPSDVAALERLVAEPT